MIPPLLNVTKLFPSIPWLQARGCHCFWEVLSCWTKSFLNIFQTWCLLWPLYHLLQEALLTFILPRLPHHDPASAGFGSLSLTAVSSPEKWPWLAGIPTLSMLREQQDFPPEWCSPDTWGMCECSVQPPLLVLGKLGIQPTLQRSS